MKAAIYSRKSKFSAKGDSIENQIQMCKDYCNLTLRDKNIDEFFIYEDEGFSGKNTNRPEFQRLINDAHNKKFEVLICYRLDRISRNVADFSTTLELLQAFGIDFVSIKEQFDTTTPMGRAMIYISSVFAQLERETISERVRDNMLELAKTGRWLGGTPPIGYETKSITYHDENLKERSLTQLIICEEDLKLAKLIFKKYLEFKSLSGVEAFLLQNYYKTRRGFEFDKLRIKRILENLVYAKSSPRLFEYLDSKGIITCGEPDGIHGFLTYNKLKFTKSKTGSTIREFRDKSEWIAAVSKHKGIIEDTDWIEVQKILNNNRKKFIVSARTHNALLTGILKCAKCGSGMRIMHGLISKKTGKKFYYYTCTLKKDSKGSRCDNANVKVDEIDPVVINALKNLSESKTSIIKKLQEDMKTEKKEITKSNSHDNLMTTLELKEKQIDNLMDKLSTDPDLADMAIAKMKKLKSEMVELSEKLNNNNIALDEISQNEINISYVELLLNKCSIIDELGHDETKSLIRGLTEVVTWDGDTHKFNLKFIGSEPSKKKVDLLIKLYTKKSQVRFSTSGSRQSYANCFKQKC